ncbi:N-acetyllactosaminide beta-1,3-N-acetylglucosaminyltransferase [Strongyloides ratti]|uniref:N-acetyllactosaminide beta-1,3-N-acetylglucosaminyltransferase n=1 Tax=Strongyloides ratti TaxID=34506 RepID=A0A090MNM9_STRRB|nr:N-acetyllactosaminide beta-1,3-N-acetylglucosaminyltransferase [Strongyloides ratti]CEF59671.1 N-acetyllactosaminide beta-1,3-N-acetylglucosaminyltransferase [Strongyloides ratti]
MFKRHCFLSYYLQEVIPYSKYVLFIDADIGVINPIHNLTKYLPVGNEEILFEERIFNYEISAGSYFIRNSIYTRKLLLKWAEFEKYIPNSFTGSDNVALHPYLLKYIPKNYKNGTFICNEIWYKSKSFYDTERYVACIKYFMNNYFIKTNNYNDNEYYLDNGKIKIIKKLSKRKWVRDVWLIDNQFSENDFMLHGLKKSAINSNDFGSWKQIPYECSEIKYTEEFDKSLLTFTNYKNFQILPNIIKSNNYSYDNNIILILHISSDQKFDKLKNHLQNWEGYISLAVYLTSSFTYTFETICTYCKIKEIIGKSNKLSVHFVYKNLINNTIDTYLFSHTLKSICYKYPITYSKAICTKKLANESEIATKMSNYPVNILRNVARKFSYSKYILIGDVDHMFSKNFHNKMLNVAKKVLSENNKNALVYRIFEVETKNLTNAPLTKKELKKQLLLKKAFIFHHTYKGAHSISRLDEWLSIEDQETPDIQFEAIYDRFKWEPQFVSLSNIPYHDETFPYPNRDNTVLRWEMCRSGYKFLVVNDVFMFHLGFKENGESKAVSIARYLTRNQLNKSLEKFKKLMDIKYPSTAKKCPISN